MAINNAKIAAAQNCSERAVEAAQFAAATNLPNVRERHLASERVWRAMAARKDAAQMASANRDAVKAVRVI